MPVSVDEYGRFPDPRASCDLLPLQGYGLSLGGLSDFNTRGGLVGNVGRISGYCYANK
jgi:hypothetical protein